MYAYMYTWRRCALRYVCAFLPKHTISIAMACTKSQRITYVCYFVELQSICRQLLSGDLYLLKTFPLVVTFDRLQSGRGSNYNLNC